MARSPPGEPARRAPAQAPPGASSQALPRIDDPGQHGFPLYRDAERGVRALDAQAGRAPDAHSRQLAGALAAQMHAAGGSRIDAVVMSGDAATAFAVQGRLDDPAGLRVSVDTLVAMHMPLEDSTRRLAAHPAQPTHAAPGWERELPEQRIRALA